MRLVGLLIVCLIWVISCKKQDKNTPAANYAGYTGLTAYKVTRSYFQPDSSFSCKINWQMIYDGEKLIGAEPDKLQNRLGRVSCGYDAANRISFVQQLAMSPTNDTLVFSRFDVSYNANGNLSVLAISTRESPLPFYYNFVYGSKGIERIYYSFWQNSRLVTDTVSNKYFFVNEGNNIVQIKFPFGDKIDYAVGKKVNNLAGSVPVWLVTQLVSNTFEPFYLPLYTNNNLVTSMGDTTTASVAYFDYAFDNAGRVVRRNRIYNGFSSPADTVYYTY